MDDDPYRVAWGTPDLSTWADALAAKQGALRELLARLLNLPLRAMVTVIDVLASRLTQAS